MNTCLKNQFTCSNKRCVPDSRTCDGVNDCGDFSDEIVPCSGTAYLSYYILQRMFNCKKLN